MSISHLQTELLKFFSAGKTDPTTIKERLGKLYNDYGAIMINKWRNTSNKRNSLLHEYVEKEIPEVIRYLVLDRQFDMNVRRDSDGLTPLQLAIQNKSSEVITVLKELGAEDILTEDVGAWLSDDDKGKALNIVWMDLEMTSIEDPEILECAVIITDKNLVELEKSNWVIHFDRSVLETLGDWHQKTFANIDQEGNGLFADVLKSKLTKDQVEEELLTLIKRHCPPKVCSLGGSSIHIDKQVLQKCMPRVHDYLHYRIIDVTSFQLIMRRWIPDVEAKIKRHVATNGQDTVNHRAMDDIKWSISFMKQLRRTLDKLQNDDPRPQNPSYPHPRGGPNVRPRGGPNPQPRGGSSPQPRGAPNHNHGGFNRYNGSASNHEDKRSTIDSEDDEDNDLPMISPDVERMDLYADERRLVERIETEKTVRVQKLRLTDKWLSIYNANPHLREVFLNKRLIEKCDKEFTKDSRLLVTRIQQSGTDSGNMNSKKYSTTEHWGQRKLLLTEIEFLTKNGCEENCTVIYAGAAPGSHINYLSSLFPFLDFILIDDKEFSLKKSDKIQIRAEKFSRDMARRYADSPRRVIFICNVRTFRAQADGQNDGKEDMENQLEWHKLMKPHVSLLNFRLPRQPGKTSYLKGHQIIEPWASKRPTECRLSVKKDAKMTDYNHQDFEDDLLRFQNVTRVMYYKHNMDEVDNEGLDHCYDCRAEIFILQEYLTKVQGVKSDSRLTTATATMSREISTQIDDKNRPRFINVPRTLGVIPKKSTIVSSNV